MSDYKVVMLVRDSNYDELMSELSDVDFGAMGVLIVRSPDDEFDASVFYAEGEDEG